MKCLQCDTDLVGVGTGLYCYSCAARYSSAGLLKARGSVVPLPSLLMGLQRTVDDSEARQKFLDSLTATELAKLHRAVCPSSAKMGYMEMYDDLKYLGR